MEIITAMINKITYTFEQCGTVGVFRLKGSISTDSEDDLKLLLMKAIHGVERCVLNLKDVTSVDARCLRLLKNAYCTSLRLKNPIILTDVPPAFASELYRCDTAEASAFEEITSSEESRKGMSWDTEHWRKQ